MANSPQARKRARQEIVHRDRNVEHKSKFRTVIKNIVYAIDAGDKEKASEMFKIAVPVIDSTVSKGLIHKNKAARHKSRLNKRIKALA
ncbi:MAG: 30S ribosomal protein S20 [Pseudomonadota bacterium]